MEVATRYKAQPVELSVSCMKCRRPHPRHLTRASQRLSCARGYKIVTPFTKHLTNAGYLPKDRPVCV